MFLGAFLLYAPSLRYEYVFDDDIYLNKNAVTQQGLSGWGDIWGKGSVYGFSGENSGSYRPVTLLSFALEKPHRKPFDPATSHWINVLLYALAVLGWWYALRAWAGKEADWVLAAGLSLFVVHPVHVEVVANVKNREELLVLLFGAGMVWAMAKQQEKPALWASALGAGSFFLACLSKENGLTLLPLAFFLPWLSRGANVKTALIQTLPCLAVAVLYLIVRTAVLDPSTDMQVEDPFINNSILVAETGSARIATVFTILGRYLLLMAGAYPMTYDYSFSQIPIANWAQPQVWLSVLVLLTGIALMGWGWMRRAKWALGLTLFFSALAIVSQLVVVFEATMALRFLFLPSLGFCLAIAWALAGLQAKRPALAKGLLGFWAIGLVAGVGGTLRFLPAWETNETLFEQGVAVSPNSFRTHFNLAEVRRVRAESSRDVVVRRECFSDAIQHYRASLAIYPEPANTWYNLGVSYMGLSEAEPAKAAFRQALVLSPGLATASSNLGVLFFQEKRYDSAAVYFRQAVRADTTFADGWANLGAVQYQSGNREAAILSLQKALQLQPNHPNARNNLRLLTGQ